MTRRAIDGVIWDVDGTLADTIPMIVTALQDTIAAHTGATHTAAEIRAMFGPTEEGVLRNAVGEAWPEAMEQFIAAYDTAHDGVDGFTGVRTVIERLDARDIAMAVVTGKGARSAEITIERLGYAGVFDEISAGSMEGQVKEVGIRRIVERWGFESRRVAYIGDHAADVRDARAAGVVAVTAAWAPDVDLAPILPLNPDVVLHSTDELAVWIDAVTT